MGKHTHLVLACVTGNYTGMYRQMQVSRCRYRKNQTNTDKHRLIKRRFQLTKSKGTNALGFSGGNQTGLLATVDKECVIMILRIWRKEAAGNAFVVRQTARKVSPPTARHDKALVFMSQVNNWNSAPYSDSG